MGFVGGQLGYSLLKLFHSKEHISQSSEDVYEDAATKLETHFGSTVWNDIHGKSIVDFGCGSGREAVEFAKRGARKVTGLEIQDRFLERARNYADECGVADVCNFAKQTDDKADLVLSLDSFEHFDDPDEILRLMAGLLNAQGQAWISFGWSWYHPYGGHLFSVFPWAHLIFTEQVLIRWRSDFKTDGATRFREVAGGLNQMSLARFERTIDNSPLEISELTLRPIRPLRWLHNRWTREFTTGLVSAKLVHAPHASAHIADGPRVGTVAAH